MYKTEYSKISGLIITRNEINNIDAVIANIAFVDEIIVVDSFSKDGTYEKLKAMNHIHVIQREFKNFSDQRNFAIEQANFSWILFMDADERISVELKKEILTAVQNDNAIDAYKFRRSFMFNQKILRFSGVQTDRVFRLFKKNKANYRADRTVHELLDVKGKYKVFKNRLLHYSFNDIESYKKKAQHYGNLKAQELFLKGERPNWFHFYVKPAYKFISNYFFRLGILDGKAGFIICKLNAYGVYYRYKELELLFYKAK